MSLATPVRAAVALPPLLKDNPRLDQWVRFEHLGGLPYQRDGLRSVRVF